MNSQPVTVSELRSAIVGGLDGQSARLLADRIRARVPAATPLTKGATLVDDLAIAFVIEAPGLTEAPTIQLALDATSSHRLERLGGSDVYLFARSFPPGTALRWTIAAGGVELGAGQIEAHVAHRDCHLRLGVPRGQVIAREPFRSQVFAGTARPWSLYVPAQYASGIPAAVMVFQDGVRSYLPFIPTVFDNLIADGSMPPTIGIFLDPGTFADTTVSNRSFEYDTLSDQYTRFLLDEILPTVGAEYSLRSDAAGRAIGGISSGGICAFTVAWQRPDQFGKVLSHVGSFTNIASGTTLREGGHNYPFLIRKAPPKPIRVYLQAAENDLNNPSGSWWLANLTMADALKFAGYDYTFLAGHGFHSLAFGRATAPDALRWLWRN